MLRSVLVNRKPAGRQPRSRASELAAEPRRPRFARTPAGLCPNRRPPRGTASARSAPRPGTETSDLARRRRPRARAHPGRAARAGPREVGDGVVDTEVLPVKDAGKIAGWRHQHMLRT